MSHLILGKFALENLYYSTLPSSENGFTTGPFFLHWGKRISRMESQDPQTVYKEREDESAVMKVGDKSSNANNKACVPERP